MSTDRDQGGTESATDRAGWVQRYRASGLGLKRFAAKHGLATSQLHYWTYRQSSSAASATPAAPLFQELTVPTEWKSRPAWIAEIGLPDGTSVRLDGRVDVAWAASLVESLRRPCSR